MENKSALSQQQLENYKVLLKTYKNSLQNLTQFMTIYKNYIKILGPEYKQLQANYNNLKILIDQLQMRLKNFEKEKVKGVIISSIISAVVAFVLGIGPALLTS